MMVFTICVLLYLRRGLRKDLIAPTVITAPISLPVCLLSFQLLADAKLAYKAWMRPS
jgi:hypothetical protein